MSYNLRSHTQNNIPVADPVADPLSNNEITRMKNAQIWETFRKFGHPLLVISSIGQIIIYLHAQNFSNNLIEPAITFPLVALGIASCVNISEDNIPMIIRNYGFYFCKGLLISLSVLLSDPIKYMFINLNEGWFRNMFVGTMLHAEHGAGFRTMVLFHTLNLFLNDRLINFFFRS